MPTRRDFLKNAALASGLSAAAPGAIRRALAVEPEAGSTYLDAEHVVILMQENRSFDHTFGTLRGVRGFDDPRALTLPDGNPVWVQADAAGERFAPFRLDIKGTKTTWMGSLPHSWADQVDARNGGTHDRWLTAKRPGKAYAGMPLALGYHTREDLPFYYALADAFTICDQHFCSSLTGTTPNRLHLWTGTVRERPTPDSPALVRNEDVDYGRWAKWATFPERLEAHGVSWKIYQNELSIESGLSGEEDAWLANFTDNPIEWFSQYNVRFAPSRRAFVEKRVRELPGEIAALRAKLAAPAGPPDQADKLRKRVADLSAALTRFERERAEFSRENYDKLSPRDKSLHARAFCTNAGDPAYRELAEVAYGDGDARRRMKVPKGDVLHQFRADVAAGTLPTVSWLVSPERFSDHPSSAWYGAWYVSEVMDILTRNPAVWKKTVFLLTYDENDGYFDHAPPFVAPHPRRPETGAVTAGIDAAVEYVDLSRDRERKPAAQARESPIGLGYRVPLVIASPWTRGGCVCSQVFDHTSVLQFLEKVVTHKTGRAIEEANVSRWRRTVCGDLTSAFQPAPDGRGGVAAVPRDAFLAGIHDARFKPLPTGYRPLTATDLAEIRGRPHGSKHLPRQEPGVRRSCALPYDLAVEGHLDRDRKRFTIRFAARNDVFGVRSAGAPFIAHAVTGDGTVAVRNYAVAAGDHLTDSWAVGDFAGGRYHLRVYGPNGFYREFLGDGQDPPVDVGVDAVRVAAPEPALTGRLELHAVNREGHRGHRLAVTDHAYGAADLARGLRSNEPTALTVDTASSFGWYDFGVRLKDVPGFERRYAGRVETGAWGFSDPAIGRGEK